MTIGELASRSRVPASTIRYWERIGALPLPVRVSGQRRYGEDASIGWLYFNWLRRVASGWKKCGTS
jgi:DNA-binding transcriptional MerR regulator